MILEDFQDRADKGVQHLFERQRSVARGRFIGVQQFQPPCVQRPHPAPDDSPDQGVFGLEVIVDGREIHSGFGGDGAQGSGLDAFAREEALGGIEDTILGSHTYVSIIRMNKMESRIGEPNLTDDDAELPAIALIGE